MKLQTKRSKSSRVQLAGKPSLQHRLGGADALSPLLDEFFELAIDDPHPRPPFTKITVGWHKEREKRLFSQALCLPPISNTRPMGEANDQFPIEQKQSFLLTGNLANTLGPQGAPEELIHETLVGPLAVEVVTPKQPNLLFSPNARITT